MKEQLVNQLKKTLADVVTFYLKAHNYHWNVEGPDFSQYHELFGELYGEVYGSVDSIAELIRTLDAYAPGTLARLKSLSTIVEDDDIPSALEMARRLYTENEKLILTLITTYNMAEAENEFGVSNHIQDRIEAHKKHSWMLRSTGK
jgi:starvation-inducible DNA-binding protein